MDNLIIRRLQKQEVLENAEVYVGEIGMSGEGYYKVDGKLKKGIYDLGMLNQTRQEENSIDKNPSRVFME